MKKDLEKKFSQAQKDIKQVKTDVIIKDSIEVPLRPDLNPVCKDSDIIVLDEHRLYLTSLLAKHGNTTTLLYRGSRDGWTASDFHRLCDNQGPTVTLYYTDHGRFCGSFTAVSWKSYGNA